ncbi:MAG: hypothetical protein EZS28_025481 [Streblomastix strix]|uniref:RRM domain-containing protein n=1 Tax=Streblomastix strix TaxID=222440 RepID=A0A5J4V986_9EUKA|nr:MAG: hypothetical protein EZS28_025481 [Streblomastix strix]
MAKKEKKTNLFTVSGANENWIDGGNEGQGQGGGGGGGSGGYSNAPQRNRDDRRDRGDRDQGWRDDRQGGGRRFQDERYQGPPRDNFRNRDREFRERDGEDGRHRFSNADDTRGRFPPRRYGGEEQNTQIDFGRKDIKDNLPDKKPFLVVISNFPPGTDDVELAEHFEQKGCKIDNMDMPNGLGKETAIMELEDKDSLKIALELSRSIYKDYSLLVELKTEDKDKPVSGQQHANIGSDRDNKQYGRQGHDRDGYRGGYNDRQDRQDRGYRSDNRDQYRGQDHNSYSSYSTNQSDRGDKKTELKRSEDGGAQPEKTAEKKPKMNFTVNIESSKKKENPFGDAQPVDLPPIVDEAAKPLQEPQPPK